MREWALRQTSLDTGREVVHSYTKDEKSVQFWRDHKMDRQDIIWREVGEWQEDDLQHSQ